MNGLLTLLLAVALSAGNAEFDKTALDGAQAVAFRRAEADILAKGPAVGKLKQMMLADPGAFADAQKAKELGRERYLSLVRAELASAKKAINARLGIRTEDGVELSKEKADEAMGRFESYYATEREMSCAEQAKMLAGTIRPPETEFEVKDDATLRREMTEKVAAQQKTAVFEENLKYLSETIVDPVISSARREMKRQRDYLMRTRCEASAPSALGKEIEANLRKNVAARQAKATDPAEMWGVFPKTLAEALPGAVEKRTLERVVKNVDDVTVALDETSILKAMAKDPAAHRKAAESEKVFRGVFASQIVSDSLAQAVREMPSGEREEFAAYVRAHAASSELVRAVETRIRRELLPKWKAARAVAAKQEADRIWPTLGDGTWYPNAALADAMAARSDYAAAVRAWRTTPELKALVAAAGDRPLMEETSARADRSVSAAFDLARSAIAAQNAIVGEVGPAVLGAAKDRKASFWRTTPNFKTVVGMLTDAVEEKWDEERVTTLWGDGARPKNAADQHAALFPSVRKRIELVARQILEDMKKPEPKPERRPEPEEKPKDPSESDAQGEERQLLYSIVVEHAGDEVTVRLSQGKTTVAERSAKAKMSDYQGAMKFVSDKLGADILKLK